MRIKFEAMKWQFKLSAFPFLKHVYKHQSQIFRLFRLHLIPFDSTMTPAPSL
uniref:Uncharacterized protein n=1 Tax=Ascaris lumbricoides TaxID=6252 RepID=A0A9J2Q788_ASCLU